MLGDRYIPVLSTELKPGDVIRYQNATWDVDSKYTVSGKHRIGLTSKSLFRRKLIIEGSALVNLKVNARRMPPNIPVDFRDIKIGDILWYNEELFEVFAVLDTSTGGRRVQSTATGRTTYPKVFTDEGTYAKVVAHHSEE